MSWFQSRNSRKGQVGIIILLIVVVMSTIGISVISRSTTDVSISNSAENANRALDAAESGAEQALANAAALNPNDNQPVTGSITSIPNINVQYTVNKSDILDTVVEEGFSAALDVRGAPAGGNLSINWSRQTACAGQTPASLVITIYATPGTSPAYRKVYAGACAQTPTDNFPIAGAGSNGFFRQTVVALNSTDALVRIRPVYNQTALRVASVGWNLPVQQFQISATAQNTLSNETKALQVTLTLPAAPSIFDFTLFAGGSISN